MNKSLSVLLIAISILFPARSLQACSWDYLIWSKDRGSDTPLFRVVWSDGEESYRGYVDREGNLVIPPVYESYGNYAEDFFDGFTVVTVREGDEVGDKFLHASGKILETPLFEAARDFSEGMAAVRFSFPGTWGMLDSSGRLVLEPRFDQPVEFHEGRASFALPGFGAAGYIDPTGREVIPPRLLLAESFSEGRAVVVEDGPCWYWAVGPCSDPVQLPGHHSYRGLFQDDQEEELPRRK